MGKSIYPDNWPSELVLKTTKASRFVTAEHNIYRDSEKVGCVYRGSYGWAFSSERYGKGGGGYSTYESRREALWDFAANYASVEKAVQK